MSFVNTTRAIEALETRYFEMHHKANALHRQLECDAQRTEANGAEFMREQLASAQHEMRSILQEIALLEASLVDSN